MCVNLRKRTCTVETSLVRAPFHLRIAAMILADNCGIVNPVPAEPRTQGNPCDLPFENQEPPQPDPGNRCPGYNGIAGLARDSG